MIIFEIIRQLAYFRNLTFALIVLFGKVHTVLEHLISSIFFLSTYDIIARHRPGRIDGRV